MTSKWNPEKKRSQKITGKLLGKITQGGFIETQKYALANRKITPLAVRVFGATSPLLDLSEQMPKVLQSVFTDDLKELLVLAFLRIIYHPPIKNVEFCFKNSYLSEHFKGVNVNEKMQVPFLKRLDPTGLQSQVFLRVYSKTQMGHMY